MDTHNQRFGKRREPILPQLVPGILEITQLEEDKAGGLRVVTLCRVCRELGHVSLAAARRNRGLAWLDGGIYAEDVIKNERLRLDSRL